MLAGIGMDENLLIKKASKNTALEIIYEDEVLIVVNKPTEFLSVPGKEITDSVYTRIKEKYPNATGPLIVHRLDMSTSGILRVDLDDRPKQLVCYKHGKNAETIWEVIERKNNKTRVYFYPITGRTHQLRVHAAHKNGLNLPIIGDDLYGKKQDRLHLHAEFIAFLHPSTNKKMSFRVQPNF